MNRKEFAKLKALAPAPGRQPTRKVDHETISLHLAGMVERLPDRTWRLTNRGMDAVTKNRIECLSCV